MKSVLYHQAHFEQLKSSVLRTAGIDTIVTADCYPLSLKISTATGKRISETTLKRIYGFTTSSYKPSSYTLNSLSEYIGFTDWADFCQYVDEQISVSAGSLWPWARVRSIAMKISLFHLQGNQYKSGVPYELTIGRQSLDDFMEGFMASNATTCIVDGAAGSGKTIAITRWAMERMEAFEQDIVLFTNSLSMQQHIMSGYDGIRWLAHLMELEVSSPMLLEKVMAKYSKTAPGKFFLIVDETHRTFSTHPPNQQIFSELISLVSHFSRYPWFRMVLVCRSTTFKQYRKYFYNLITKPEWYSMITVGDSNASCQPVIGTFNDVEIRKLLNRVNRSPEERLLFVPRELELIQMPLLFQYYYKQENGTIDISKAHEVNVYLILSEYIEKAVDSISVSTDTQLLLDGLVPLVECAGGGYHIVKKEAFQLVNTYLTAYYGLLSKGLLHEKNHLIDGRQQCVICFQSDWVLGYFLSLQVLVGVRKQKEPSDGLLSHGADLQRLVLKWCLFLLARADDMQPLLSFVKSSLDSTERVKYIQFAVEAYHRIQAGENGHTQPKEAPVALSQLVGATLSLSPAFHTAAAKLLDFSMPLRDQVALRTMLALHGLLTWNEALFLSHLKELVWIHQSESQQTDTINPFEAFEVLYHRIVLQPVSSEQLHILDALLDKVTQMAPACPAPSFYLLFYLLSHALGEAAILNGYAAIMDCRIRQIGKAMDSHEKVIMWLLWALNLTDRGLGDDAVTVLAEVPGDLLDEPVVYLLVSLLKVQIAFRRGSPDKEAEKKLSEWADDNGLGLINRLLYPTPTPIQ